MKKDGRRGKDLYRKMRRAKKLGRYVGKKQLVGAVDLLREKFGK